ncbi:hypothetical protein HYP66_gp172 [Salmonella phage S118]|uniref:Uncharacterized protein n=1 Tax=Salmonella phage S118 TaxID=2231347 RepID=A0A2Z5HL98_9CAUD|nr:hypothetical protein HYP66_gp172 [Salmonella phage S118]AXC41089.1 hypothetical protein [Salmonella phage S118]
MHELIMHKRDKRLTVLDWAHNKTHQRDVGSEPTCPRGWSYSGNYALVQLNMG